MPARAALRKLGNQARRRGRQPEPPAEESIRAYHGSPHDFDRFSLDRIGTGEGAQTYGYGLYFAENEGVARYYRDALSDPDNFPLRIGGQPLDTVWVEDLRRKFPQMYRGLSVNEQDAMDGILGTLQGVSDINQAMDVAKHSMPREWTTLFHRKVAPKLEAIDVGPGHMYEVNIRANPQGLLDYDAPLSAQPQAREVFEQFRGTHPAIGNALDNPVTTGGGMFQSFEAAMPQRADAGQALREAGIPGLRYLDRNSRGPSEGTRNLVMFDDSLIDILRKYGIGGAGVGLGSLLFDDEEDLGPIWQHQ